MDVMAAITSERIPWDRYEDRIGRPPLRLVPGAEFRRRRLLALVVILAFVSVLAAGASHVLRASSTAGSMPVAPVVLVAQPGDSYWTLANQIHDGGDLRSTVDELVAANGGRELHAGDRIVLPEGISVPVGAVPFVRQPRRQGRRFAPRRRRGRDPAPSRVLGL
jgi:hypothetical protein